MPGARIAIDGSVISSRLKGAGRVVKNLLAALPQVDPDTRYIALVTRDGRVALGEQAPQVEIATVPTVSGTRWELRAMGQAASRCRADLLLTLREIVGFGGPPTVMHVAEPPSYRLRAGGDVSRRGARPVLKDAVLQGLLRSSVRRAALVTAGSRTTAEWLRRRYSVDPPVIYPGIDPVFVDAEVPGAERHGDPYFLHPATGDARDNTELVLQGFARAGLPGVILRTMGASDKHREKLRMRANELNIRESVDFVGWVSDTELRRLYSGAIALVHPTRFECFAGLQPLEAMALGTPVIALDAPGSTEALEGAAELLGEEDVDAMANALARLATDDDLRNALGAKGRDRVQDLTWTRAAEKFSAEFRRVLA